jgi:hypothetical protein
MTAVIACPLDRDMRDIRFLSPSGDSNLSYYRP